MGKGTKVKETQQHCVRSGSLSGERGTNDITYEKKEEKKARIN